MGYAQSFYFDIYAQWEKGQNGEMPFTPAVQIIFALDKAVQELADETVERRIDRYQTLSKKMREGLKDLGFELLLLPGELQSNIITTLKMPEKMDYWRVHDKLKERGITIYSGKGVLDQRKFRVATMGSLNEEEVDWFLTNLREVMEEEGLAE